MLAMLADAADEMQRVGAQGTNVSADESGMEFRFGRRIKLLLIYATLLSITRE